MRDAVSSVRYPHRMRFRAPPGLPGAIAIAARRRNTSPSEWARATLLRGLAADGVALCEGRIEVRDQDAPATTTAIAAIDPRGLDRPKGN
jgi:hypothetical protein